jgi:hypothetical protein
MTGDTKHRTLKDQLESEIADMERDASEDPEKYNGQPLVVLKLEPYRLILRLCWQPRSNPARSNPAPGASHPRNGRFSMKLVTAMSTAALVLVPAVGFAEMVHETNQA